MEVTRHDAQLREGNFRLFGIYLDEVDASELEADAVLAANLLDILDDEISRRNFHVSFASLGENELRNVGGNLAEYACSNGIDGQLIWDAVLSHALGKSDAAENWDRAKVAVQRLRSHIASELQKVGERKRRWTLDEAKAEVEQCLSRGIRGRNEIAKETGIPKATVSRALKALEVKQSNATRKVKTVSYNNLENVELARLVAEQKADDEPSPLEEFGDNPKVNSHR